MPTHSQYGHNFIDQHLAEFTPRWTAGGSHAHLTVGDHPVRANPRRAGASLHVDSEALAEAARHLTHGVLGDRRITVTRSARGYLQVYMHQHNVNEVLELLNWLAHQPYVSTPRAARSSSPRRSSEELTDRRFGVELEFISRVPEQRIVDALNAAGVPARLYGHSDDRWSLTDDGSLSSYGRELRSPPLRGEEGMAQLRTALRVLRELGVKVDLSCGVHVHHDIHDLRAEGAIRLVKSWTANQDLIDFLVPPSRRMTSSHARTYCAHWTERELRALGVSDAGSYVTASPTRYKTVNVECYGRQGTVEVRQHGGTLHFRKLEAWIRLGQSMIEACRRSPLPVHGTLQSLLTAARVDSDTAAYLSGRALHFGMSAGQVGVGVTDREDG